MTDIKERKLNPYDPFDNPTENCAYRADYREVDPRIGDSGYEIPLLPDKTERKGIRRYMNIVGLSLLLAVVGLNVIYLIIALILEFAMAGSVSYAALMAAEEYINFGSSILIAINGLIFLISNLTAAVVGSRVTGIRVRSYFRPVKITKFRFVQYMAIGVFVQAATGIIYAIVSSFMESMGVSDFMADVDSFISPKSVIATVLYTCIIAPVTEELLYRGFVLKNLSRVSQSFGIIVSAALFGLAHENLAQFLLAMPLGIFMARITIKHNSIIPSVLIHVAVNTLATIINMCMEMMPEGMMGMVVMFTLEVVYYFIAGAGMVFWILEVRKNRLPANTIRQSYRGVRIALSAPWLVVIVVFHFGMALLNIAISNM